MRHLVSFLLICTAFVTLNACSSAGSPKDSDLRPQANVTVDATPGASVAASTQPLTQFTRRYPTPKVPEASSTISVTTDESVSEPLTKSVREASAATAHFFKSNYAIDLSGLSVHVTTNLESHVAAVLLAYDREGLVMDKQSILKKREKSGVETIDHTVFIYFPNESREGETVAWLWGVVAGEATRLSQHDLVEATGGEPAWSQRTGGVVPNWFLIGHVDFVRATMLDAHGIVPSRSRSVGTLTSDARTLQEVASDDLMYSSSNTDEQRMGIVAIDLLAGPDSTGARVFDFWRLLAREVPYNDAFAQAFGMNPADFYARFEATRVAHSTD